MQKVKEQRCKFLNTKRFFIEKPTKIVSITFEVNQSGIHNSFSAVSRKEYWHSQLKRHIDAIIDMLREKRMEEKKRAVVVAQLVEQ